MTPGAKGADADAINLVAFCSWPDLEGSKYEGPWMRPVERESLLDEFQDWDNEVTGLLKVCHLISHSERLTNGQSVFARRSRQSLCGPFMLYPHFHRTPWRTCAFWEMLYVAFLSDMPSLSSID